MNIYLRKILKHDITHQISITKEILNGFFGVYNEKDSTLVQGKKSGCTGIVTFLLSTDPRFGGEIKQIINSEGGMQIDDILLFVKGKNSYVLEILTKNNPMHATFLSIMSAERHLVLNIDDTENNTEDDENNCVTGGVNKIFYGVPGCGKSHHIQHKILDAEKYEDKNVVRTTFYQDYSNTDFVGQILPKIKKDEDGKDIVEYIFNPGPFTLALIQAISNPTKKVALVIEEINRGNAPAIFGDIFQLLDRNEDGISEYGIKNVSLLDYLNTHDFDVDGKKKRYLFEEIKIPGNLSIYATMNTSDQNVYTLDTAFTRRWEKERIPNELTGKDAIEKLLVPGMEQYTWGQFVKAINTQIRDRLDDLQVNEDKQVGVFFVKKTDLLEPNNTLGEAYKKKKATAFAHKVLEYLWDDVTKLDHSVIFKPNYKTFHKIVEDYLKGIVVFNSNLFNDNAIQSDDNGEN